MAPFTFIYRSQCNIGASRMYWKGQSFKRLLLTFSIYLELYLTISFTRLCCAFMDTYRVCVAASSDKA